jgi:hypothetical protein
MRQGTLILFGLVLGLPWPIVASAFPQGRAALSYESRYQRTHGTGQETRTVLEQDFGLRLDQVIPNYGFFRSEYVLVDDDGDYQTGRWLVELSDVPLNALTVSGTAGDTFVTSSLLSERFANIINPQIEYRGGKVTGVMGEHSLTLFGGEVITREGAFGNLVREREEFLYGVQSRFKVTEALRLGASLIQSRDDAGDTPFAGVLPEENTTISGSVEYALTREIRLMGEVSRPLADRNGRGDEVSWLVGPRVVSEKVFAEANAFSLHPTYFPTRRFAQEDREGWYVFGEYRFSPIVALYSGGQGFRNNLLEDPAAPIIDTLQFQAGGRFLLPNPWPFVFLRGDLTSRESRSGGPVAVETTTLTTSLELFQQYGPWRPLLRFQHIETDDDVAAATSTFDLLTAELRRSFGVGTFAFVRGELNWQEDFQDTVTESRGIRVGGEVRLSPHVSLRGEVGYTRQTDEREIFDRRTVDANGGVTATLPFDLFLNVDVRYNQADDVELDTEAGSLTVTFRLIKRFAYGTPVVTPRAPGLPGLPRVVPRVGVVSGRIFIDQNGDGVPDLDEPGVPGLNVRLVEIAQSAVTDAQGAFRFSEVPVGPYTLAMEVRHLPVAFDLTAPPKQKVLVERAATSVANFAVARIGAIQGVVINDQNGNGAADPDEVGLPDVVVSAQIAGEILQVITDRQGTFRFDNLRPGEYTLTVDPSSLVGEAEVTSASTRRVTAAPGVQTDGGQFLVRVKPRPVIRRRF